MRYLFILTVLFCCNIVTAENISNNILSQLSMKLDALEAYSAEFTVLIDGEIVGCGVYAVDKPSFHIQLLDKEIYSDGDIQYDIDNVNKEVVIDHLDKSDNNLLSNPAQAFDKLNTIFNHQYVGVEKDSNTESRVVKLTPKESGADMSEVILYIDVASGYPTKIRYNIRGASDVIEVRLDEVVEKESSEVRSYKKNKDRYRDYEIIDFR